MQKKRCGRQRELFILGFNLPVLSVVTYATKRQLLIELVTDSCHFESVKRPLSALPDLTSCSRSSQKLSSPQ